MSARPRTQTSSTAKVIGYLVRPGTRKEVLEYDQDDGGGTEVVTQTDLFPYAAPEGDEQQRRRDMEESEDQDQDLVWRPADDGGGGDQCFASGITDCRDMLRAYATIQAAPLIHAFRDAPSYLNDKTNVDLQITNATSPRDLTDLLEDFDPVLVKRSANGYPYPFDMESATEWLSLEMRDAKLKTEFLLLRHDLDEHLIPSDTSYTQEDDLEAAIREVKQGRRASLPRFIQEASTIVLACYPALGFIPANEDHLTLTHREVIDTRAAEDGENTTEKINAYVELLGQKLRTPSADMSSAQRAPREMTIALWTLQGLLDHSSETPERNTAPHTPNERNRRGWHSTGDFETWRRLPQNQDRTLYLYGINQQIYRQGLAGKDRDDNTRRWQEQAPSYNYLHDPHIHDEICHQPIRWEHYEYFQNKAAWTTGQLTGRLNVSASTHGHILVLTEEDFTHNRDVSCAWTLRPTALSTCMQFDHNVAYKAIHQPRLTKGDFAIAWALEELEQIPPLVRAPSLEFIEQITPQQKLDSRTIPKNAPVSANDMDNGVFYCESIYYTLFQRARKGYYTKDNGVVALPIDRRNPYPENNAEPWCAHFQTAKPKTQLQKPTFKADASDFSASALHATTTFTPIWGSQLLDTMYVVHKHLRTQQDEEQDEEPTPLQAVHIPYYAETNPYDSFTASCALRKLYQHFLQNPEPEPQSDFDLDFGSDDEAS